MYLFILINIFTGTLLFSSGVGHTSCVFFLPFLLVTLFSFLETKNSSYRKSLLVIFFLISNFFPSFTTISDLFGMSGRDIYYQIFRETHHNPLGWQNFSIRQAHQEFYQIKEKHLLNKTPLYLVENLHEFTSTQFIFIDKFFYDSPEVKLLEFTNYKEIYRQYLKKKDQLFEEWVHQEKIPVILEKIDPWISEIEGYTNLDFDDYINTPHFDINERRDDQFAFAFNSKVIQSLKKNGLLAQFYIKYQIPKNKPEFNLYCLKSLKRVKKLPAINKKLQNLVQMLNSNHNYYLKVTEKALQQLNDTSPNFTNILNQFLLIKKHTQDLIDIEYDYSLILGHFFTANSSLLLPNEGQL
ncbi:hypothetical protein MJH12_15395, partial [bacterium]|nr:hypothetical protein [bacterium]